MNPNEPFEEPRLQTRTPHHEHHPETLARRYPAPPQSLPEPSPTPWPHRILLALVLLILLGVAGYFYAQHWVRSTVLASLPQIDGTLKIPGLAAPVTVTRDPHGVPHITAGTLDDLLLAQGFVTAQDRLFQMDTLRRHAAGELAEILGPSVLGHDRLQRTLQIRAAADRALQQLPAPELHRLEQYARGVNANIAAQHNHLPIEFGVLRYTPAPWTPRDSILIGLVLTQDLSNSFPTKLAREALTARLPADLVPDLYPVGSWRDHPPTVPPPDLTQPGPPIEQVPLDESQATLKLQAPTRGPGSPASDSARWGGDPGSPASDSARWGGDPGSPASDPARWGGDPGSPASDSARWGGDPGSPASDPARWGGDPGSPASDSARWGGDPGSPASDSARWGGDPGSPASDSARWGGILASETWDGTRRNADAPPTEATILASLQPLLTPQDPHLTPGSNNWVVSGSHTASGSPILSNDTHLSLSLPGIWYETVLTLTDHTLQAAGVTLPGLPLITIGRNATIAWGVTNLGADVQELYIETTRNNGSAEEFQSTDGTWQPIIHLSEPIKVKHARDEDFEVLATRHGNAITPILNPVMTPDALRNRTISLRWTIYDPAALNFDLLPLNTAHDWPTFLAAVQNLGGPSLNYVYADTAGHIGYHAAGRIPLRGNAPQPIPSDLAAPDTTPTPDTPTIRATPDPLTKTGIAAPAVTMLSGKLSPVPSVPTAAREWTGYIPFDNLPAIFDPPAGVLATANARITPDDYPYPIALNWAAPYRNERLWKLLAPAKSLTPADMLALQNDAYSDLDHVLAERIAYALDHTKSLSKQQQQAADLLRTFDGRMKVDSVAATILSATKTVLWPMLLAPHIDTSAPPSYAQTDRINASYLWGERDYALEQILMHTPPRWLPQAFPTWNDFLAAAVTRGLDEAKAPADLTHWTYGSQHQVDIESPIFTQSELLRKLLARPTGTGPHPQSGDGSTIKQVGRTFGPSQRFTADLATPDSNTMNLVLGQSGNPASPWFEDQFPAWLNARTYPFPLTQTQPAHTLTLTPQ